MPPTDGWIDLHAHYTPPDFMELAERKLGAEVTVRKTADAEVMVRPGQDQRAYRKGELSRSESVDERIQDMDATGCAVQVISPGGTFSFYEQPTTTAEYLSAAMNDRLLDAVDRYPTRLQAMITLPMQDSAAAIRELERARQHPGVTSVRIGSSVNDWELDNPALWPIYQAAEAMDMPLFLHPYIYGVAGAERMREFNLSNLVGYPATTTLAAARLLLGGVLEEFPRLRICIAHGGGYLALAVWRLTRGHSTHPETRERAREAPATLARRFYVDSIVHSVESLDYVRSVFGDGRVVCGTDYPFQIGDADPRRTVNQLDPAVRDRILRTNALEFLGQSNEVPAERVSVPR
jgi:aminocarboxymuconate-semialdehyde decarboxylase